MVTIAPHLHFKQHVASIYMHVIPVRDISKILNWKVVFMYWLNTYFVFN